jgi:hypothetical protein
MKKISPNHQDRVFDHVFDRFQKSCSRSTVDDAVVKGEAESQPGFGNQSVLLDDRLLHDAACAQDGAFRGTDYGREEINIRKSEVGDGERSVEEIIRRSAISRSMSRMVLRSGVLTTGTMSASFASMARPMWICFHT